MDNAFVYFGNWLSAVYLFLDESNAVGKAVREVERSGLFMRSRAQ